MINMFNQIDLHTKKYSLTDEDKLKIPLLIKKWAANVTDIRLDPVLATHAIEWLYKSMNLPLPTIYFVDSVHDAILKSWELRKLEDPSADINDYTFMSSGNVSDYGWLAFYDLLESCGIDVPNIYHEYIEHYLPGGIYDAIAYEECIIVCNKPKFIKTDSNGNMHCATGHAIEWENGWGLYYIHGREMPPDIFETEITRERFMGETNAEIRGGIYAILGPEGISKLLGTYVADSAAIVHSDGSTELLELLKTHDIFPEIGNVPFAWINQVCPTSGTHYLIGCEPHHTSVITAKKIADGFSHDDEYLYDTRC